MGRERPNGRYAFVQNSPLNLPDMNDGSISMVNLSKNEPVAEVDVVKKSEFNPNCILYLPKWHKDMSY